MRIPGRKIYRAFPELDRFTDVQCQRYLAYLGLNRWAVRIAAVVAWGAAFVFLSIMLMLFTVHTSIMSHSVFKQLDRVILVSIEGREFMLADIVFTFFLVFYFVGMPFLAAFLLRDYLLRRLLRRRLEEACCPQCRQSLIGLPIDLDDESDSLKVRCPECGKIWQLHDLGLDRADLSPDAVPG